jgi:hypothetical protein
MTGYDVRWLRRGDSVLIRSSQFLFSRVPRRWVKAIVIEARRNAIRPDVPDVLIQIRGLKNLLRCTPYELRSTTKK